MSGKSFTLAVALPLITIGASNGQIADEKKAIQGMALFSGMVGRRLPTMTYNYFNIKYSYGLNI